MTKRILAGMLALTMVFGGAAVSAEELSGSESQDKITVFDVNNDFSTDGDTDYLVSGDFEYYDLDDGTVMISKYIGNDTVVTVPAELDGKPVKIIRFYTFRDCNVTDVTISEGIETINMEAFRSCTMLKNVTIPRSVTWMDYDAFDDGCDAVIHCYKGSHAEEYAKIKGMRYELIDGVTVPMVSIKSNFSSTTNAVRINWSAVSGASGYRVYRYNTATKKWVNAKTISGGSTVTYRDTGLKAGTNYKYKVKAYVKENGKTYWGDASSTITTATKPTTVKITKAGKTSTAVRLYWNKVDCSGYKLQQYNPSTKTWKTIKLLGSSATDYRVSGLKKNTAYKFRIQAYKTAGTQKAFSAWSATKTVTTKK